jgi:hypothetical protein
LTSSYEDLKIIEAMEKTINKSKKKENFSVNLSTKSDATRQVKIILEAAILETLPISCCIQNAHDAKIVFPDTFENVALEICLEYYKRALSKKSENAINKCVILSKFVGKLYTQDILKSESIKGILNIFVKCEPDIQRSLTNIMLNSIYEKAIDDDVLQPLIPDDFERRICDGEEDEENEEEEEEEQEEEETKINENKIHLSTQPVAEKKDDKKSEDVESEEITCNKLIILSTKNNQTPMQKFKDLLCKLSPTNVSYILRETSTINFTGGEDFVKELASALIDFALTKLGLIKSVVQLCLKIPDTIVPNFSILLMKKHVKLAISSGVFKCSELDIDGYSQLLQELHAVNFYDRFDIIVLLEKLATSIRDNRTSMPTICKFIEDFFDLMTRKKLSNNMIEKLNSIGAILLQTMQNDDGSDTNKAIEKALKVLIKIIFKPLKSLQNSRTNNRYENYHSESTEARYFFLSI